MNFKKFQAMTWQQKVDYIWEYFRWQILAVVGIGIFLGVWISGAVRHQDPILDVIMINAYQQTPEGEAFAPFLESQGYQYFEDAVVLDKTIRFGDFEGMPDMNGAQMLMCSIAAGEPDLIFWETRDMMPALQDGSLMDLREILPPEILEQQKENLVYCQLYDTQEEYPCGIFLEKNPWITEQMYYVDCTAGIAVTAKDKALAADLILWLLDQQN